MNALETEGLNVWVVEDEARLRELLVREIAAMGHKVVGFSSAEEAWSVADRGADVAMLDLNLPGIGGMELFQRIRESGSGMSVVILTGFGGFDSAVQALRWRADDYLTKPCSLADIDRVLSRILAQKRELQRRERTEATAAHFAEERLPSAAPPAGRPPSESAGIALENVEREHILTVLRAHQGNKRTAAKELGISLRTLYNKLNAYRRQGFLRDAQSSPP